MSLRSMILLIVLLSLMMLAPTQTPRQIIRIGPDMKLPFSPAVKAGQFIYVAGTVATDDDGKIIAGDIKTQTKRVLDNISRVLIAAGSNIRLAASATVYLKNISDFQAMNEVYKTYWSNDPPARTTVQGNMVIPEALIEISMTAIPNSGERKVIHPQGWLKPASPYSYGIQSGDTLFLSGLVARRGKDNALVEGDIQVQTKAVLENAGEILSAAGMAHADIVSSRVFITDTAVFQPMNAAYRKFFPKNPPARATVRSALMAPQFLVEISTIAVKGGTREVFTTPNPDGSAGQPNPNLSSAVRAGDRLYVSGMLGYTDSNKGDIKAQTRETLVRIGRTIAAAGFDWKDIVDGVVYITDVRNFAGMNEAYREMFTKDFPARATVEAGLVAPDGLVEIMFTAVK